MPDDRVMPAADVLIGDRVDDSAEELLRLCCCCIKCCWWGRGCGWMGSKISLPVSGLKYISLLLRGLSARLTGAWGEASSSPLSSCNGSSGSP